MPDSSTLHPATLAERVIDVRVGPCHVLMLPTAVRSVVSWRGSFCSYPNFEAGEDIVQELTTALLDKGTRHHDRFALADALDTRGAELHFSADGLHIDFAGKALRPDVGEVLRLMGEQLMEPALDADEFEKARANVAAAIQRSMESTGTQAASALSRRLYAQAHPNYAAPSEEELALVAGIDVEQVRQYHRQHFGSTRCVLALAGDLDPDAVVQALEQSLGTWPPHPSPPDFVRVATPQPPGRQTIEMPDKQNLDVRLGQAVHLRRQDADFIPLFLATYIFGGNFSSRLMDIIRDEMGLTYGIRASLAGITTEHDGSWQVAITLSQENLERGIEATMKEVRRFVNEGVTAEELAEKKTTIAGAYKVNLATTAGLASSLLRNAERGFDVGYLDRYPAEIEGVTLEQANSAVARHLDPDRFQEVLAGSLALA